MSAPADRHLSADSFTDYVRAGVPILHPIPGTPRLVLFFDPDSHRVGLRGPATERPPHPGLANVTARTILIDNERQTEIAITNPGFFADAYPLLCAIADRAQLHGRSLSDALVETLRRFGHLLRPEDTLGRETETGLVGELCLVEALMAQADVVAALTCWRGPAAEEHDFGFDHYDAEVKTTTSEKRQHWISSLTQLVPTPPRLLWLVSIQLTEAGDGGTTLDALVARIRARTDASAQLRDQLDQRLRAAGWRERFATPLLRPWRLRTAPTAFIVNGAFPHLTPNLLTGTGIDHTRIPEVRYRIDLTGLTGTPAPDPLAGALTAMTLETG